MVAAFEVAELSVFLNIVLGVSEVPIEARNLGGVHSTVARYTLLCDVHRL